MDKIKALKLLEQYVNEVPLLRSLPENSQDYKLWVAKITDIVHAGLEPEDENTFVSAQYEDNIIHVYNPGTRNLQTHYQENITEKETALKAIIQKYKLLGVEEKAIIIQQPPKAFIVHGGKSGVLDKLCEFIEALGIRPLVVEMLPSQGMTIPEKVKKYQKEADCAIILATRGGIIDVKSGKQHPRLNVIDELSSFWGAFPQRVILLLEHGAELPSNKAALTYESFVRQSMDRAFIAIARELVEMGILKTEKPSLKGE
jgi:predicted nucleotide-binding protein